MGRSTLGNKTRALSDRSGTYWRLSKTPLSFRNELEKIRILRYAPRDLLGAGFRHIVSVFAIGSTGQLTSDWPGIGAHGNRWNNAVGLVGSTPAPMAIPEGKPAPIAAQWCEIRDHRSGGTRQLDVSRSLWSLDMSQQAFAVTREKETGQDLPQPSLGVPEPDRRPLLVGLKTPTPRDVARTTP